MWLMTTSGIFSITQAPGKGPHTMQIRSRWKMDLLQLRQEHPVISARSIITTNEADYRYRMVVTRPELRKIMEEEVEEIDYTNFKAAAAESGAGEKRNRLLHDIWLVIATHAAREGA